MFGMFDWLMPGASSATARRSGGTSKGLLGFPGTPAYGTRVKTTRSAGGLVGLLGFPSTPSYQDASVKEPECPEDDDEGGDTDGDGGNEMPTESSASVRSHGTR